jgi:hypothetical protein
MLVGSAAMTSQSVRNSPGVATLQCSIFAAVLPGVGSSLTSLGANAGFAPPSASLLSITMSATVDENADAVTFGGQAGSSASVRIFLEEFSAAGAFLDGVAGTPTIVYEDHESWLGSNVRFDELHNVRLSSVFPVVAGRFYRFWIDSLQWVFTGSGGPEEAVSNFLYNFGPATFAFH